MITQEQINEVIKRILESLKPQKIILFGSYAEGKATEESDLDLLIVKESNLPSRFLNRKARQILSDLRIPVDVIVKTPKEFETYKNVIGTIIYPANRFGKIIYESR